MWYQASWCQVPMGSLWDPIGAWDPIGGPLGVPYGVPGAWGGPLGGPPRDLDRIPIPLGYPMGPYRTLAKPDRPTGTSWGP